MKKQSDRISREPDWKNDYHKKLRALVEERLLEGIAGDHPYQNYEEALLEVAAEAVAWRDFLKDDITRLHKKINLMEWRYGKTK